MSARPHFANPATFRARTTFAGGLSPWTQQPMPTAMPTAASPFPAPRRASPKSTTPRIDITKLKIKSDIPLPSKRGTPPGKYDAFFADLKPKQCIECKPDEVQPVAAALRKYLKDHPSEVKLGIVMQQHCDDNPKVGRVWLYPADEITGAAASRTRGAANPASKAAKAKQ